MEMILSKDGTKEVPAWYGTRKKTGPKDAMEPIKRLEDVAKIKKLLRKNPRDYCLFVAGIYTAYRAGDLLSINVGHAKNARTTGELHLREQKTDNKRRVTLSKQTAAALRLLVKHRIAEGATDDDPLFVTEQKKERVSVSWLGMLVKKWCKQIGLKGNFGAHTLRKTFGYQNRVHNNVPLEVLQSIYGHSSSKITLTYVCIQDDEKKAVYLKEF